MSLPYDPRHYRFARQSSNWPPLERSPAPLGLRTIPTGLAEALNRLGKALGHKAVDLVLAEARTADARRQATEEPKEAPKEAPWWNRDL